MKYFNLAVIALIASTAAAAPVEDEYPEVIPGDGLPSLASLNLTSADLYDPDFDLKFGNPDDDDTDNETRDLFARYPATCRISTWNSGPVSGAKACYNYLKKLGTQYCAVHEQDPGVYDAKFCTAGKTRVVGEAVKKTKSYCRDVAHAVEWSINHCSHNGKVKGAQAAGGNGALAVITGRTK